MRNQLTKVFLVVSLAGFGALACSSSSTTPNPGTAGTSGGGKGGGAAGAAGGAAGSSAAGAGGGAAGAGGGAAGAGGGAAGAGGGAAGTSGGGGAPAINAGLLNAPAATGVTAITPTRQAPTFTPANCPQ
jgi:hypothetical protein